MTREEYRQALTPYLPPPILERAVANYNGRGCCSPTYRPHTLVDLGFSWVSTPEGDRFWSRVHNTLLDGRDEFPPIPT